MGCARASSVIPDTKAASVAASVVSVSGIAWTFVMDGASSAGHPDACDARKENQRPIEA
jgi:hypothetical protein